ncbi:MAG: hypothetical protein A2603_05150 [Bdellovibrionales bacterium RIFOXYD1_FULL_55_31]|nr:MAG: hypothetical protein A2603_05150 [Bdellovibrionales bacterium RIFOXYD1_FULL_55_31]
MGILNSAALQLFVAISVALAASSIDEEIIKDFDFYSNLELMEFTESFSIANQPVWSSVESNDLQILMNFVFKENGGKEMSYERK